MNENPSYYAIIPANVRYDKDLTPNAKLLYGEISALCNKDGYCWASNSYFANLYGVSKQSVSTWISSLAKNGYVSVEIERDGGNQEILYRYIRIFDGVIKKSCIGNQENLKENNTTNNTININNNNNNKATPKNSIFDIFESEFGRLFSPLEMQQISDWQSEHSDEVIQEALTRAVMNDKRNFAYIRGILNDWKSNNVKTVADVMKRDEERKSRKGEPNGGTKEDSSIYAGLNLGIEL